MQIWPAVDILDGKCVRLLQGDYKQATVYGQNPADMASRWCSDGAECMHLVDLDGARDGSNFNFSAVRKIIETVEIPCQLGGGIRSEQAIREYLELGVSRLVVGTKALKDPNWLAEMAENYPNRLVIGIDVRDGRVATDGWQEVSNLGAIEFAKSISNLPIAAIIYTDILKDGMLNGPNIDGVREFNESVNVPVIASGGVTTREDVSNLAALNISGCIIGRSLYEGKLDLREVIDLAKNQSQQA
ncbi:MAG: 1-(5-phosphoribosyl)-5-[(5-phosphoribosylamino)methylideneamino]imidazole-4-carboxamide isomerase [Planctomycetota bacterium]|nr:1-(5-phosphoribosyl)-5-[(5-phosphoribosylamino)methylideneamino]imidazole-4-carboxamide isomerase [Planctomycetota bacterium]